MTVMVLNCTLSPIEIISFAAGTSTGRNEAAYNGEKTFAAEHEARKRRVKNCFDKGHMSVFEFAHMSFYISGISRACANQLVRHRLCSFCQESQRYTKIDTAKDDWYIIPERLRSKDHISRLYLNEVRRAGEVYNELIADNVPLRMLGMFYRRQLKRTSRWVVIFETCTIFFPCVRTCTHSGKSEI